MTQRPPAAWVLPLLATYYDQVRKKGCTVRVYLARLIRCKPSKPISSQPQPTWTKWIGDDSPELPWPWQMETDTMDQAIVRSIPHTSPPLTPRSLAETLDARIASGRIVVQREVLADGSERISSRNILP
jgi:hypothetical protein